MDVQEELETLVDEEQATPQQSMRNKMLSVVDLTSRKGGELGKEDVEMMQTTTTESLK